MVKSGATYSIHSWGENERICSFFGPRLIQKWAGENTQSRYNNSEMKFEGSLLKNIEVVDASNENPG